MAHNLEKMLTSTNLVTFQTTDFSSKDLNNPWNEELWLMIG